MPARTDPLTPLIEAIADNDAPAVRRMLAASPSIITARATADFFLGRIGHYLYGGDTALHIASAAHRPAVVRVLIRAGADVRAKNRRGAEPLHYAADSAPGFPRWNPRAQAATIAALVKAGADPNAVDKSGVMPLHRAVRTRSAAAVRALLGAGADPRARNGNGSTPLDLAQRTTGRGGSGSPAARSQQAEILEILARR
jgi:hypothetical protein